jgi:lysozyme
MNKSIELLERYLVTNNKIKKINDLKTIQKKSLEYLQLLKKAYSYGELEKLFEEASREMGGASNTPTNTSESSEFETLNQLFADAEKEIGATNPNANVNPEPTANTAPSQPASGAPTPPVPTNTSSGNSGKISPGGTEKLKSAEAYRGIPDLVAYSDPPRYSIAYGNTYYPKGWKGWPVDKDCGNNNRCVKKGDTLRDKQEADALFDGVVDDFNDVVRNSVTSSINQNQFDALVIFAYNMGPGAFKRSNLLKLINENPNDRERISADWPTYTKNLFFRNGVPQLASRRQMELDLYFK